MAQLDASRFLNNLSSLFAPSILEGQVIEAYVDEPITPYIIQGDNLSNHNEAIQLLFNSCFALQSQIDSLLDPSLS